jgi:hypothetical protein
MATHGVVNNVRYQNIDGTPSQLIRNTPTGQVIDTTYQVVDFEASFQAAKDAGSPLSFLQKYALS